MLGWYKQRPIRRLWNSKQPEGCEASESLVELAETRSVARALRFAGFGLEFTSAEEVSHVAAAEPEKEQTTRNRLHQCSLKAMRRANRIKSVK